MEWRLARNLRLETVVSKEPLDAVVLPPPIHHIERVKSGKRSTPVGPHQPTTTDQRHEVMSGPNRPILTDVFVATADHGAEKIGAFSGNRGLREPAKV